ncbi:MAG: hypothetical protein R3F39_05620 [Myxococcota bacterium]
MSGNTVHGRARQVIAALRALGRALAEERGFSEREPLAVDGFDVTVRIPMDRASGVQLDAAASVLAQGIDARLAEVLRAAGAFEQGRVYCFLCQSSRCEHADTPDTISVFAGYAANGRPEWVSFANLCLARGDERVDRLYAEPPEVIGIVQGPSELASELLPGFGHGQDAWRLLGQVAIGLLPRALAGRGTRSERVALTLQLVETGARDGKRRLRLNVLGLSPEAIAEAAAADDERGQAEAFRRTLGEARARIDTLGLRLWRAAKTDEDLDEGALALALLTQLRSDLERVFRAGLKRTRHAQTRHLEGDRPTDRAREDLAQATPSQCYLDTRRDTVAVLGPQGRAHIYARDGRLVTSLRLKDGELERKVSHGRWELAPPETLAGVQGKLSSG